MSEDATNSAGRALRYEREKQGLSIDDVARQMHLSAEIIRDLEAGNVEVLPGAVYIRGYVRAYCKLLKIDAEALLDNLIPESELQEEEDAPPQINEQTHRLTRLWGSLAVFSVIILLVAAWWLERPHGLDGLAPAPSSTLLPEAMPEDEPEALSGIVPAREDESEPVQTVIDKLFRSEPESPFVTDGDLVKITLRTSGRSWARLTDGSGEVIINGILSSGHKGTVYGVFPFDFKFGDARSVRIWVDDVEYDLEKHISILNTAFFMLEKPFE